MENPFQIMVKGVEGKTSVLNFPNNAATVDMLFEKYAEKTGMQADEFRLVYGTKPLQMGTGQTLKGMGITRGSSVFATLRLLGGHNPKAGKSGSVADVFKQKGKPGPELKPLPGHIRTTTTEPCMISLDDDANVKRAKMPCGHVIDCDAMTTFAVSILEQQLCTFQCPYTGQAGERCHTVWPFFLVKHVALLYPDELRKIEEMLAENYSNKSFGVQQCPGCNSYCSKDAAGSVVRCPFCSKRDGRNYDFCWSCLQRSTSHRCQNPQCNGHDPRLRYLETCPRKDIIGVADCPAVRACDCGTLIEHTDDCKHMTCGVCKANFCFICLKKKKNEKWQCGSYKTPCTPAPIQKTIKGN